MNGSKKPILTKGFSLSQYWFLWSIKLISTSMKDYDCTLFVHIWYTLYFISDHYEMITIKRDTGQPFVPDSPGGSVIMHSPSYTPFSSPRPYKSKSQDNSGKRLFNYRNLSWVVVEGGLFVKSYCPWKVENNFFAVCNLINWKQDMACYILLKILQPFLSNLEMKNTVQVIMSYILNIPIQAFLLKICQ